MSKAPLDKNGNIEKQKDINKVDKPLGETIMNQNKLNPIMTDTREGGLKVPKGQDGFPLEKSSCWPGLG